MACSSLRIRPEGPEGVALSYRACFLAFVVPVKVHACAVVPQQGVHLLLTPVGSLAPLGAGLHAGRRQLAPRARGKRRSGVIGQGDSSNSSSSSSSSPKTFSIALAMSTSYLYSSELRSTVARSAASYRDGTSCRDRTHGHLGRA